jgi:hypothetical protein
LRETFYLKWPVYVKRFREGVLKLPYGVAKHRKGREETQLGSPSKLSFVIQGIIVGATPCGCPINRAGTRPAPTDFILPL